jgi:myo-inositol-1(or 4)-monophosphatase
MKTKEELVKIHSSLCKITKDAGLEVLRIYNEGSLQMKEKSVGDFVTSADLAAEKLIIESIKSEFPEHKILSEETAPDTLVSDQPMWIIDPIDGTTNFSRGIPLSGISIAFSVGQQVLSGAVYNPFLDEMFTATRGGGAFLNNKSIRVSNASDLKHSIIAVGTSSPKNRRSFIKRITVQIGTLMDETQDIRRLGAAAIDLCFVACGRVDGFYEPIVNPWDIAAGRLIAKEAGATCGFLEEMPQNPYGPELYSREILISAPRIFEQLKATLKQ